MQKLSKIAILVIGLITTFVAFSAYFVMPTIQWGFYGIWILLLLVSILLSVIFFLSVPEKKEYGFNNNNYFDDDLLIKRLKYKPLLISFIISINILFVIVIVSFFTTNSMFYSDDYRKLIGEIQNENFENPRLEISLDQIRIVDEKNAAMLGDKKIGEQLGLGSQYSIGDYNIQTINNGLYWVAPLEYKSFFKWLNDSTGTPGFILVSAYNSQDVQLITEDMNGNAIKLKYLKNAYGFNNIKRHLYYNGYFNKGLMDYTFEVDNTLTPYYVVSVFDKTIGFGGKDVSGVLTINAQTGNINEYDLDNIPEWVDRVEPESIINEQLNDWGEYVHGYWNSTFLSSQKEVVKLTSSQKLIFGNDGNSYWYSGVSSVGRDNSIIGFILTDSKTKETFFYQQSGATEQSAMKSAEGKVQEKGYVATFPSMYKIAGIPTYVMSLKDDEGLVKLFAMVSVENYEIVGTGSTLRSTLREYQSLIYSKGNQLSNTTDETIEKIGVVSRYGIDIRNGNTFYYLQISDDNNIYVGNSNISDDLPITKEGDNVMISHKELNNSALTDLISFENIDIR